MKIKMKLTVLLAILTLPAGVFAQESPGVKVAGIRVVREIVGEKNDKLAAFNTFEKGTALALLFEAGGAAMIKVDVKASVVDSFTDNTGANLMVKSSGFARNGFGTFPKIAKGGKMALVEITAAGVPSAEATKLVAKGTLVVQTGSAKKAVKSAPFEPKEGAKVTVGDIEMTLKRVGKPNFGDDAVELEFQTSNKGITMLAGVKFYNPAGAELESDKRGSSSMGFGKKYTYGQSYSLKKAVSGKVVVEFEMWTDLVEKKIPFSVTAGIGG